MENEIQLKSIIARSVVFSGIVSTFIWAFWFNSGTIGYNAESRDGASRVSAGTTPLVIVLSLAGLVLSCVLLNTKVQSRDFHVVPMWRRAAAFVLDFWYALVTLSGLFGTVHVLLEGARTGTFQWHFQRDYSVPADSAGVALVFLQLGVVVGYFLLPLMRRGQTVGCWIFRLVTVNADGYVVYLPFSTAMRRLLMEFRGVCSPFKTFKNRDDQGRTFYDRESGFTVLGY